MMLEGAAVITRTIVECVLDPEHGLGPDVSGVERGGPDGWGLEGKRPDGGGTVGKAPRNVAIIVQFGWTTTRTSDGWRVAVEPIGVVISRPSGVERLVRPGSERRGFPGPDEAASMPVGAGDHLALDAIVRRCVEATGDGLALNSFHAVLTHESDRLSEAAVTGPAWQVRIRRGSDHAARML